jgi:hypothetical protein
MQTERYVHRLELLTTQIKSNYTKSLVVKRAVDHMKASGQGGRTKLDKSSREEILAEGEEIMQMIEYGSVVPERGNLPYFIISMRWLTRWQKYTGCFKVTSDDEDEDILRVKDKSKLVLGDYPGEINLTKELKELAKETQNEIMAPADDFFGKIYLKRGIKED